MSAVFRSMNLETRANEDGSVTFRASTPTEDRYRSVIAPPWVLKHYRANPVVPWAHDYSIPPVGKALSVELDGEVLMVRVQFDESEHNALGRLVASQVRGGFLSAGSVGFSPGTVTDRASLAPDHPHYSARGGPLYTRNELLEFSIVPVPGNANALAQRGVFRPWYADEDDLQAQIRELQTALHNLSHPPAPSPFAGLGSLLGHSSPEPT